MSIHDAARPRSWLIASTRAAALALLTLLASVTLLTALGHGAAHAQGGTTIGLTPTPAYTEPGLTATVGITITDVISLYGVDVHLAFDPAVAEVVDSDPGIGGVQIRPVSSFLSPDLVILNTANNTTGSIQFAVTQISPTMAVTGSGLVAEIVFEGVQAGTTPITITYQKPARRDGTTIPATPEDGELFVGPAVPELSIEALSDSTARLSWTESVGAVAYELFRDTDPYFMPTGSPLISQTALSYDDPGALGDADDNHAYVVKAVSASGLRSAPSNRVGEFETALSAGDVGGDRRYNLVGMPVVTDVVTDAASLADRVGAGVYNVLRYVAPTQGIEFWLPGLEIGTNFSLATGDTAYLHLDENAPARLALTGGIPAQGSVQQALTPADPGASCSYNFITLPLDRDDLTTAEELAADVGGVYLVLRYDAPTQGITFRVVGLAGENFAVHPGRPYVLCLTESAPTSWP